MMDKFAQSLAAEDTSKEKNIYFDFCSDETSCMFKKAYVTSMKNPTGDNIKSHIANRLKSELGVNPNDIKVVITVENSNGDNIDKGTGVANVKLNGQKVSIPFQIVDGEISDFTEMKVGNESIAYNKQSIGKVSQKSKEDADKNNSFIGTAKIDNENTDRGFLDEVIKIRDSHISKQTNTNAGRYITASEACDEMLNKTAEIKEVDKNSYAAVETMVRERVASTVADKLEKIASIDIDGKISHAQEVFAKMERLPLKSVHSMKHGQTILFPEINGSEVSMTTGIVFKKIDKDFYKIGGRCSYPPVTSDYVTIVMSHDGRIALLGSGQTMLALEDDSAKFKLPTTKIRATMPGETYLAVVGNTVVAPFFVQDRLERMYGAESIVKELSDIVGVHDPIISIKPTFVTGGDGYIPSIDLILIPGETFKSNLKKVRVGGNARYVNGAVDKLKKLLAHRPNLFTSISASISPDTSITADPDTKVIKIKGLITGYVSNKKELNPNANHPGDHIKIASYDILHIEKIAKDKDEYSVKVNGKNKKDFGNKLNKKETQTVMLSMGYKPDEIGEAMHSADNYGRYHKELPLSTNINKLYDGEVDNRTKKIMKKLKNSVFDENKAQEAVKNFGINMASGTLGEMASESDSMYAALEYLSKFAQEAKAAAITFEKCAMEYKSEELQNVAKLMATANNLFSFVKSAYEGKEYNFVKEACESILTNKDALDEITTGIIGLSNDQFTQSNEYVPYEALKTASEVIGGMYELAKIASVSNQDIICIACGVKSDEMLQNGKCDKCSKEELASMNEESKKDKSRDDKEINGNIGEEDDK